MGSHLNEWGSGNWLFTNNDTSSFGKGLINWTNGIIWGLDLNQEDWLLESWSSGKLTSVKNSSGGWDDLTTTSMDSIGMEGNIIDVESDSSHVLVTKDTFLGSPLESSFVRILDFTQELDTLSGFNEEIWSIVIWSESPNLKSIRFFPVEFFDEDLCSFLGIGFKSTFSRLDLITQFIRKWEGLHEKSVMLVWGFGEAHLG